MSGKYARAVLAFLLAFALCRGGYMASGLRDRQVLVIEPRAGVDYTTSALDISPGRASQMTNLIGENGMLRKRLGFEQLRQDSADDLVNGVQRNEDICGKRINGMWPISGRPSGDGKMIVHAGSGLYLWWMGQFRPVVQSEGGVDTPITLDDVRTDGIWKDGKLYIIGGGDIIVVEPHEVMGLPTTMVLPLDYDPYVPTTTIGIADDANPEAVRRAVLDDVNLLTPKRVNKMLGRVPGEDEFPSGSLDTSMPAVVYRLDGEPDTAQDIKVTIETMDENGEIIEIVLSNEHAHSSGDILYPVIGGEVVTSYATLGMIGQKGAISFYPELLYKAVSGDLYSDEDWDRIGEIEAMLLQVDVSGDEKNALRMAPVVEGIDNITVEFSVPFGEDDAASRITGAGFGIMYGADGASDRLFLGGIPGHPGRVYYSGYDMHGVSDWSYWPANGYITCGSERAPVVAFSRLSDGVLAVHNAASGQEPTIRFVTGESVAEYEDEEKTVIRRYYPVFRVVAGNAGEPVVSRDACKDFYGDHLILTDTGVYAVVMKQNIQTSDRHLTERSRSIRVKLGEMDLHDAAAVVYEGRYWLAVGDTVFLADSKAAYTDDAGGTQYEWYQFDGIGARCFAVIGDELWFGTSDGRICRFREKKDAVKLAEKYSDAVSRIFRAGDVTFDVGQAGRLVCSEAREDVVSADALIFDEGLYRVLFGEDELAEEDGVVGLIDEDRIMDVFDGMRVYLDAVEGGTSGDVYVGDVDRGEGTFRLYVDEGLTEPVADEDMPDVMRVLIEVTGVELTVDRETVERDDEGGGFFFGLRAYGEPLIFAVPTGDVGPTLRGRAVWRRPVCAEWYSKVFDFGTNQLEKTLLKLTVATEPVENGQVKVGFETRAAAGIYGSSGIGGLDLGGLDFIDFTLVGFASSYTRTLMQRHVNFALFRFRSDEAAPCCIHNMTVLYTVVGSIRGGR